MNADNNTNHSQTFNSYEEAIEYREKNFKYNHSLRLYTNRVFKHNQWITMAIIISPEELSEAEEFRKVFMNDFSKYHDVLANDYAKTKKFVLRSHSIKI
ncbi:hypothetical protein [Chryseobacterium terrae]|uniref:Uncharacterized protein n=1 Tax=Chryseobacterium terrae TaxID=3163299 RepID=A0ABW8Y4F3_9FLAO